MNEYASSAIRRSLDGECVYCKFLSANDSGQTGGHQSGILISTKAREMLFREDLSKEHILKRTIRIKWQDDIETESTFTWYESKRELRVTRFGRGFDLLRPERTGSLFVFVRISYDDYEAFLLDTEDEINQYLDTFGISPTETNGIIETARVSEEYREQAAMEEFINGLTTDFPPADEMSAAARMIYYQVYLSTVKKTLTPDQKLLKWTDEEYKLFRALEYSRYGKLITGGFESVDEFVSTANRVLNRRKSRAGKSLENHLRALFDEHKIRYTPQGVTEGNKKPDFIFPSETAYHDLTFPIENLLTLAAKTTCKDRWRQVINEADRLRDRNKYLCTLQQGISGAQMDEMESEKVILVVPKPYISSYPSDRQHRIWTVDQFIRYVKEVEGV